MELAPNGKFREEDNNGDPLVGGLLYTYVSGTTTPKATYQDRDGLATNTNPVVLDSRGECDLWLDTGYYTLVLKDSLGNTIWSKDKVANANDAALASAFFRDIVYITSANSPYTITSTDNGKLISIDSSSASVTVNMPQINSVILPFNVCIKLRTGTNTVSIVTSGTDTFDNGLTSKTLSAVGQSAQFIGDIDQAPDQWGVLDLGVTTSTPNRRTVSGNTTVTTTDDEIYVTAAATITLLAAAAVGAKPVRIVNAGTGTVTVTRASSDTIWGETSQVMYNQYDNLLFIPDGTSKYYIGT